MKMDVRILFLEVLALLILSLDLICDAASTVGTIYSAQERDYKSINDNRYLGHHHCTNIREVNSHYTTSGIYTIYPIGNSENGAGPLSVFCEMGLESGTGWTIIQRRTKPTTAETDYLESWDRNYDDYKNGFGDLHGNFWLGLHNIRRILLSPGMNSSQSTFDLYVGIVTHHPFPNQEYHRCAYYSNFKIGGEADSFQLMIGNFDTTAAGKICGTTNAEDTQDALTYHKDEPFSTHDHDNDNDPSNCAQVHGGGWWYKNCRDSNLNGEYLTFSRQITWKGISDPIDSVIMAIKRV